MKIVHVLLSLKGGGIQNFLLSLAPEQVRMGHEVTIIVTDEDDLSYSIKNKEYLESFDIPVYSLNRKVSDKVSFFKTWFALRRLLKKLNPDIVNSHGIYCHNAVAFSVLGTGISHCCTIHSAPEKWGKMTKLINHGTPLIYCSEAAYQLREQDSLQMIAINNGIDEKNVRCSEVVDLHKELDIQNDDKIVVLVGSTRPEKNYPFLIDIVNQLKDEHIHFCICGGEYKVARSGANNKSYISLEDFKPYKNIHLLGLRSDIPAILNGADAYLSCSIREGLPISALEAFFSGIPCILSPIPQHTMISDGISFCFIPSKFDPKEFVDSIYEALKCSDSHEMVYSQRKEKLKNFLIDRCAKEYIDFYKQVITK